MAHTQNTGTKKRSVFLRVWECDPYDPEDDGRTHYYARIGRLEIEGWLYGADREDVKEFLRRVLKAEAALPEQIVRAVDLVVNYLASGVQLSLTTVAASAGYDYNESEWLSFTVEMFYDDNCGWAVEVRAVNARRRGRHILKKRACLRPVTVEALRKGVAKVVRRAYNAQ